ncbi:MAG: helix-turn-helix transcriptional regulator [Bacteroidota bacterium]
MRTLRLQKEFELFIAGIAASQSLFMAIYSLVERKRDFRNILLFLFFLVITIRLTKSILWVYWETTPGWLINIGFAAHALSGPALLLYVWHVLYPRKWSKWQWIHFIPGLLLVLTIHTLSLDGFWHLGGYSALLFHQMIYSLTGLGLFGFYLFKSGGIKLSKAAIVWTGALVLGTTLLQFLYFSNYILGLTPYLLGPIVYAPLIYFLAFLLFKNPSLLQHKNLQKNGSINLSEAEMQKAAESINHLMREERLYLDANCTLTKVSKAAKLPPYLVSYIINKSLGKSFPDFLNGYRIEAAKDKLKHPDYQNTKIASIAYDVGFNSISAFNIFFKRTTGTTPSKYRDKSV